MNIIQITPGAGGMYCGGCLRDNALVAALRKQGHSVLMVPLYLPLTLEDEDQSRGTPIFFSGINVYLDQKSSLFRKAPRWLHRLFTSPKLLKLAAGSAGKTRAEDLGGLTLSMLRGEEGHQARELDELIAWLKGNDRPDVISLSNALLVGMARRLKQELGVPIVCSLQGEDAFLDALPEEDRNQAWRIVSERAREVDRFIAPSRYFGNLMLARLGLRPDQLQVVQNGINLDGFGIQDSPCISPDAPPVLGYLARMCPEKGLGTLVDAFIALKQRGRITHLKLKVGGGRGPADEAFVNELRQRLKAHGVLGDVEFHPNLTREEKLAFLRSLTVFSVPALYGEAFGLYVIEALASGVPVAQPRHAAFPELIEATGGGVLCEPDCDSLTDAIEDLLLNPAKARQLGETGRKAVSEKFSVDRMAREFAAAVKDL
jgi:glycosyltransferase involved in cell wall biosynthesis